MIKILDKISRKHYIQCALAVLFTGVALYFTSYLWMSKGILVSFHAQADNDIEYRVYYTDASKQQFSGVRSLRKNVKSGSSFVEIMLPVKKIVKFRLDFSNNPGKIEITDLRVSGSKDVVLNGNKFNKHQIDSYEVNGNKIILSSSKKDPYIPYKKELNLSGKNVIDWLNLIIISVFVFLLVYKFIQYLSEFKTEKQYSRLDILMLAVFFGLLFVPMSHISDAERSEQENRMLAEKPLLIADNIRNGSYGPNFETWYNDHFFGRDTIMELHRNLKYFLAPTTGSERILVGKDGWLFFKPNNGFRNFANVTELSEEDMKNGLQYLQGINKWCKKHGKKFYYVIVPDKSKIYGENYRLIRKVRPDEYGIAEQFVNYIHQNSDINVLYLRDILLKHKGEGILYYKGDTHWTALGAYYGYEAIGKNISRDYPISVLKITKRKTLLKESSDLYKMFGIKETEKLTVPDYSPKASCKEFGKYKREKDGMVICKNKNNKYNAFILRDSFFSWLIPYVSDTFKDTKILWKQNMATEDLKDIEENYDIVIVENVERYIPQILKRKFPALPKKEK